MLRLLARREHSEHELFKKLLLKGYSATEINPILTKIKAQGLQSDVRFLENFLRYRSNKGYGPLRIRSELLERGLSPSLVEQSLQIDDNAWFELADQVWRKRFRLKIPHDAKVYAQQARFLQYRGFTHEQIRQVLKNTKE